MQRWQRRPSAAPGPRGASHDRRSDRWQRWDTDFDVLSPAYVDDPFSIWDELRTDLPGRPHRPAGQHVAARPGTRTWSTWPTTSSTSARSRSRSSRSTAKRARGARPALRAAPHLGRPAPAHLDPAPPAAVVLPPPGGGLRGHDPRPVRRLVDGFVADGRADAAADYAQQIPVRVIAASSGVPASLSDTFTGWVRDVLEFADDPERRRRGDQRP